VVRRVAFAVPGDLATATGGYAYDRRIIAELEHLGWQIDIIKLGDEFPWPSDETRKAALDRLTSIPASRTIVIDGLAFGVLPDVGRKLSRRHALLALVHHPLALETGLSPAQINILHNSERAALSVASRVVVTSKIISQQLSSDYAVPSDRIIVVPPGTDPSPIAHGHNDGVVRLLSIGAIVQRKAFDVLVTALAALKDLPWRLSIVGDSYRDRTAVAELVSAVDCFGLNGRVTLLGVVSPADLAQLFLDADLFVLASHFEGYGMAYAEAIAHGLPVIGTTAGAIPETVPEGAGVLVAPGDVDALANALRRLIERPTERATYAAGARKVANKLPKWQDSVKKFAEVLESIV
jgi:glycosyltransferase involved in cell wall biosynthesis